jgi:hypothetical protein
MKFEYSLRYFIKGEKARLQEFLLHSYSIHTPLGKKYQWSIGGVGS